MAFEFLKTHELPTMIRELRKELNPDIQTIAAYRAELARRNELEWCVHEQNAMNAAPSILMNCNTQTECEEYIRTQLPDGNGDMPRWNGWLICWNGFLIQKCDNTNRPTNPARHRRGSLFTGTSMRKIDAIAVDGLLHGGQI